MDPTTRKSLETLPKIDLHRHLEGSVRPGTLGEICREGGIPLPTYDHGELASMVCLQEPAADLEGFFQPFRTIKFCFADRDAIARITFEAAEDAWRDNIEYAEFRFSPEFMAFYHRLSLSEVMDGIVAGMEFARRKFPIGIGLIVSISRNLSEETMGMPWPSPEDLVSLAVDYMDRGVVGLDLSGRECGFPPGLFAEPFRIARKAGLGITVHAGEDDGPESVRDAIELLGASRIGHGVRVVRDPEVVKLAVDRGAVFEICPTSNLLTHALDSLESHPIRQLYEAGARVTVNTDDPTVCGVTLTDECALLMDRFGFTFEEIEGLMQTANEAAFGGNEKWKMENEKC